MQKDATLELLKPEGSGPSPRSIHVARTAGDRLYRRLATGAGVTVFVLMALIGLFLFIQAGPVLREEGFSFFTQMEWRDVPDNPTFGIAAIMFWTFVIAVSALVIAVPLSIGTALFLTEYAPPRIRRPLQSLVDLLAAVPSLIYGLWGLFFLQPILINFELWLSTYLDFIPFLNTTKGAPLASSAFIAAVVVGLMVVPICTSVMREVFGQTPPFEKEGALALGATRWGMIRTVVLPFGRGGIIGGSMLGLGRALGETIAVAVIINPIFTIRASIIESGANGVAPHIALRFGEATKLGLSALMAAGLALFAVTLIVNMGAAFVVSRSRSGKGVEI